MICYSGSIVVSDLDRTWSMPIRSKTGEALREAIVDADGRRWICGPETNWQTMLEEEFLKLRPLVG